MPIDLSQPTRVIFNELIAELEAFIANPPVDPPTGTVITGGVNSLTITSLEELPALTATGGVSTLTVSLATPTGTAITGGTNSLSITSLETITALSATGGVNTLTVAGA